MNFFLFFVAVNILQGVHFLLPVKCKKPPPPTPPHEQEKPSGPRIVKAEDYINKQSFVNPDIFGEGCDTCSVKVLSTDGLPIHGPIEKDKPLFSACCSIEEPSYLELDELRSEIGGTDRKYSRLEHLLLTKVSIYEFLFDTDHDNIQIDTVYNSDFVVGYFRPGTHADGTYNNNGDYIKRFYLAYCELSPEMLSLTLEKMTSLRTLHLDHVRLIPYPPGEGIPSDLLNIVVQRFSSVTDGPGISLSLIDCRLSTLKIRQFGSKFSEDKFVSMSDIPQLRMLSLANNGLKEIDNLDFFERNSLKGSSKLWYLDLSSNELENLVGLDLWLPSSVTSLHLEGNKLLKLPSMNAVNAFSKYHAKLDKLDELWLDVIGKGDNVTAALSGQMLNTTLQSVIDRAHGISTGSEKTHSTTSTPNPSSLPRSPTPVQVTPKKTQYW